MNLNRFICVYENVETLKNLQFSLPLFAEKSPSEKVLYSCRYGTEQEAHWDDVANYQLLLLQKYLRCYWREMLPDEVSYVEKFLFFLKKHSELQFSLGSDLIFFLREAQKQGIFFDLVEQILQSKTAENILLAYQKDEKVQDAFAELILAKVPYFDNPLFYVNNYQMLMDWLPKWKNIYPNVWKAVAQKFQEAKSKVDLNVKQVQEIYALYEQD